MTDYVQGLGDARLTGMATDSHKPDPKLVDGARQFEAMMLQKLLKPLQFGASPDNGEESAGGAGETVRSFGTEAIAKAIATRGGFGVAREIVRQVTAERDAGEQKKGGTKVL